MSTPTKHLASCIFCKIVAGEIPSFTLLSNEKVHAFMDIGPIAKNHALVIPKYRALRYERGRRTDNTTDAPRFTDVPDDYAAEILPAAKKVAQAIGCEEYNILQNNGRNAHQVVDHVHFHIIPKDGATDESGLVVGWPTQGLSMDQIKEEFEKVKARI